MSFSDNKVFTASLWSTLSEIVAKIISPVVFLILTRLLSPSDFGVVAVATTLMTFMMIVSDLGTAKFIIQKEDSDDLTFNILASNCFWINAIIGLLIFMVIFISSNKLAVMFNEPKSIMVIKVMAFQVIFNSLSSLHNALKKKSLDFKFLFYTRLITIGCPLFLAVPIAFLGGGYWAIVIANLVGSFLNFLVLWLFSSFRPIWNIDFKTIKGILDASIWNTIEEVFIWLPIFLDTYLISNYISSSELGLFTSSRTVYLTLSTLLLSPLLPVLYSAFVKVSKTGAYKEKILSAHHIIFSIAMLSSSLGFVFSDFIENVVFDDKWVGIGEILKFTFILMGATYFNEVIIQGLRAKGYFKAIGLNVLICTLITIPFIVYSIKYGILVYVVVRYSSLYLRFFYIFYKSRKVLNISFLNCFKQSKNILIISLFLIFFSVIIDSYTSLSYFFILMLKIIMSMVFIGVFLFYDKRILFLIKSKIFNR
ncbi:oligosaccharide flippase family protein [Myroides odoratimimus]|uniref:oligosaccharide flippase family protein n=1 Tax=Myroides odoratimimus TaxID=76832 RepID=UPI003100C681